MRLLRRVAAVALVALCVGVVVAYQANRPAAAHPDPVVFVPSPGFYKDFSPSVRATIADVYWLYAIQYYGEHAYSDHRLDSLPAMVQARDHAQPALQAGLLLGGLRHARRGPPRRSLQHARARLSRQPLRLAFPVVPRLLRLRLRQRRPRRRGRSGVVCEGSPVAGRPCVRVASGGRACRQGQRDARRRSTSGPRCTCQGDKYAQQKAVAALDGLLPKDKGAREKAVAGLENTVPHAMFAQFVAALFQGYQ